MKNVEDYISEKERKEQAFFDALIKFIGDDGNLRTYFHTTSKESACKSMMNTGFEFEDFDKTVDFIQSGKDTEVIIRWNLSIRQAYGKYTVILQMSKRDLSFERFKTGISRVSGEPIEILPHQLVKGYIDKDKLTIYGNPNFDPYFTTLKK